VKRAFDLVLALALLPAAVPILLLAALAVRLDTPGPAFFRQQRVGLNQKLFTLVKIRTMATGTKQAASHEVGAAQITRVGNILRRTKIDELPQLLSVIMGDMSLVGPRPCLPVQEELVAEREKRGVFTIRPGITGLAQVTKIDMSTPVRLAQSDAAYVAQNSLMGDFKLIIATAFGAGSGDAVK